MLAVHGTVTVKSATAKKMGNTWLIDFIFEDRQSKELGNTTDIRVDTYEGVMWLGSHATAEGEAKKWIGALPVGSLVELKFALLESKEFTLSSGGGFIKYKIRLYPNNLYTIPI